MSTSMNQANLHALWAKFLATEKKATRKWFLEEFNQLYDRMFDSLSLRFIKFLPENGYLLEGGGVDSEEVNTFDQEESSNPQVAATLNVSIIKQEFDDDQLNNNSPSRQSTYQDESDHFEATNNQVFHSAAFYDQPTASTSATPNSFVPIQPQFENQTTICDNQQPSGQVYNTTDNDTQHDGREIDDEFDDEISIKEEDLDDENGVNEILANDIDALTNEYRQGGEYAQINQMPMEIHSTNSYLPNAIDIDTQQEGHKTDDEFDDDISIKEEDLDDEEGDNEILLNDIDTFAVESGQGDEYDQNNQIPMEMLMENPNLPNDIRQGNSFEPEIKEEFSDDEQIIEDEDEEMEDQDKDEDDDEADYKENNELMKGNQEDVDDDEEMNEDGEINEVVDNENDDSRSLDNPIENNPPQSRKQFQVITRKSARIKDLKRIHDEQQQENEIINQHNQDDDENEEEYDEYDDDSDNDVDEKEQQQGPNKPAKRSRKSRSSASNSTEEKQIITHSLQCPNCSLVFAKDQLHGHMKTVHHLDRYCCSVKDCRESFISSQALSDHVKQSHQPTNKLHCDKCNRIFTTHRILYTHNCIIHQLGHFQCAFPGCTMTGECRRKVTVHYQQKHKERPEFVCEKSGCDYRTKNRTRFKEHEYIHLGLKPYRCTACQYSSASKEATMDHIKRNHFKSKSSKSSNLNMTNRNKPENFIQFDDKL